MTMSFCRNPRGLLPLGALFLSLTAGIAHAQGGPPTPKVVAAKPLARQVTRWDEYTGRFEPRESVDIRPRVSGFIDKVHFSDGQMVKKGDLLFSIDPRPYRLALESAQADVARARAAVVLALADYERGEQLVASRTVPVKDLEQRKANLDTARAQTVTADATVRSAELNLEWTQVTAPIDGRISDRKIDAGNLISGGQGEATLLTTIVRLDPIYFVFEASEADYLRYSRQAASGTRQSSRDVRTPVEVALADESGWPHKGTMDFVDNRLSSRSGTIRGRALLGNADMFLTPGVFGRVRLYGGKLDALLVPDQAIASDQARKIVMTVGPDNKIVPKQVTLGPMADGLRVIAGGLTAEDRVVISGIANPFVRPGAVVDPIPGDIAAGAK